jgi:hypothetical protein
MIIALERYLLSHWKDLSLKHEKPKGLSFVLMTDLPPCLEVVNFLIIPQGSSEPLLTAKVPRYIEENDRMKQKAERFIQLKEKLPSHLARSIPEVIELVKIEGRFIILEQSMPRPTMGIELKRGMRSRSIFRNLDVMTLLGSWLIDFYKVTHKPATEKRLSRLIAPLVDEYKNRFPPNPIQKRWLEKTQSILTQETNVPHLGPVHANLSPDHISLDQGQLYIFDWEEMEGKGLPLFDAFHFVTSLVFYGIQKVEEAIDKFQRLVMSERKMTALWSSWINKIAGRMAIGEPVQKMLYLLYLAEQSMRWNEFVGTENFWPQLFDGYVSWLDQSGLNL